MYDIIRSMVFDPIVFDEQAEHDFDVQCIYLHMATACPILVLMDFSFAY